MEKQESPYWHSIQRELNLMQSYLGVVPDIDLEREVLFPYYEAILRYINQGLTECIDNGDSELKNLVDYVLTEFAKGADMICECKVLDLKEMIGYNESEYKDIWLTFTWGHVLSSLCTILRMVYAYLFDTKDNCCDCGCPCYPGKKNCCRNTTSDYESWVSNTYAEDEENDITNYTRANSPWQGGIIKYNDCYRRQSDTSESHQCACGCPCHRNKND